MFGRKVPTTIPQHEAGGPSVHLRSRATSDEVEKMASSQPAKISGERGNPTADGLKLLRAFLNIRDATLRRSVVHLVEMLAASRPKS